MNKVRAALFCAVVFAAVFAPAAAQADHCNGAVTDVETPAGTFYVDDRGEEGDVWIYLESNGETGLQSGGTAVSGLYDDDGCTHDNPDQLIF